MPPNRTGKQCTKKLKTPVATTCLADLVARKETSTRKFGKAPSTTEKYEQRRKQGYIWLAELLKAEENLEHPAGCPDTLGSAEKWSKDELQHAFDKTPTRASPWVLALFIASKCFGDKELGLSTAWQIHSGFKLFWDQADPNGMYQGRWLWDSVNKNGRGNPALSSEVDSIITAVKNRAGAEGTREHSAAMKKGYMDTIMNWSNEQCPPSILKQLESMPDAEYYKHLPVATKHFFFRAFSTSGWNLWTRNFELAKLQYKDILEDAYTDDGFDFRHLVVTLENRKGWQNKLAKDSDLQGHRYEIHPQPELPSIDMEFHLRVWLKFLRKFVYGRDLEAQDYIFPAVNSRGTCQPGKQISHDTIQKWIDEFVNGAGIKLGHGKLTTHCFRRGGAQYRFMYAPIGKRWSLAVIRWWGGWAEGEHRDTLIRYLLDELYHYEEGHGDALRPIAKEADKSFLGEQAENRPATKREIHDLLNSQLTNLKVELASLTMVTPPAGIAPSSTVRHGEHNLRNNPNLNTPNPSRDTIPVNPNTPTPSMPRDLRIPLLSKSGPMELRWKQIIADWENPDDSRGHRVALKDWVVAWYTGPNRTRFGAQYGKRKLVALEFLQVCGGDEVEFLRKWPIAATGGPSKLLEAIHAARLKSGAAKHRRSKNEASEERALSRRDRRGR